MSSCLLEIKPLIHYTDQPVTAGRVERQPANCADSEHIRVNTARRRKKFVYTANTML